MSVNNIVHRRGYYYKHRQHVTVLSNAPTITVILFHFKVAFKTLNATLKRKNTTDKPLQQQIKTQGNADDTLLGEVLRCGRGVTEALRR